MGKTQPIVLLLLFVAGAAVLFGSEFMLVRLGEPQFIPPITLGVALGFIGVILPVLAWPIRQSTRLHQDTATSHPVNPFYATRVLLLAKAGSLTGAILAGAAGGVLFFLLTRPVIVPTPVVLGVVSLIGGAVLTAGSLLAERWCQIPPAQSAGDIEGGVKGEPA